MATRKQTRLDNHVDAPATVQPGDAPADTTDPAERATSVTPDKAAAAASGHLTVNAVVPVPPQAVERDPANDRIETYTATRPDGSEVTVTRNLETGETTLTDPAAKSSK